MKHWSFLENSVLEEKAEERKIFNEAKTQEHARLLANTEYRMTLESLRFENRNLKNELNKRIQNEKLSIFARFVSWLRN